MTQQHVQSICLWSVAADPMKRTLIFTAKDLPPRFKINGNELLVLDPGINRWCLVSRHLSKRHVRQRLFESKRSVYNNYQIKVFRDF